MTVLKVAVSIWACDTYFPATYAQATWRRLLPCFEEKESGATPCQGTVSQAKPCEEIVLEGWRSLTADDVPARTGLLRLWR
jgi:hypothetical protein